MKKRIKRTDKASVSFGLFKDIEFKFSSLNGIDLVESGPGWYSWFYLPSSLKSFTPDFAMPRFYESNIKTLFGTEYSGKIEKESFIFNIDEIDYHSLISSMVAFSPPLYIGISVDLSKRLKTHRSQLESFLSDPSIVVNESLTFEMDTLEESSYFAGRVGYHMKELNVSKEELFVKYVYSNDPDSMRAVEKVLNRTFLPTYGLR